jgi:hypothetical protein
MYELYKYIRLLGKASAGSGPVLMAAGQNYGWYEFQIDNLRLICIRQSWISDSTFLDFTNGTIMIDTLAGIIQCNQSEAKCDEANEFALLDKKTAYA